MTCCVLGLLTLVLVPAQSVFVLFYIGMAMALRLAARSSRHWMVSWGGCLLSWALVLDAGLFLTEKLFFVPLRSVYLTTLAAAYPLALLGLAAFIGGFQLKMIHLHQKRLGHLSLGRTDA